MHLLAAQPGAISDGSEPIDPGQSPADVIFISAADSELAALAEARSTMTDAPSLRLANLGWLQHPFSVDLYLDNTALKSKLVVIRLLGGHAYWPYGLEQFSIRLGEAGVGLAVLAGDDKPDEELFEFSNIPRADWEELHAFCVEGGPENAAGFLALTKHMLGNGARPAAAKPLLRAGYYWPGQNSAELEAVTANWTNGAPVAAIVFYRALLQGAGLHPINRLVRSLMREGINPLPVFVASLKDPVSAATLTHIFEASPPDVVINGTSFAVSSPDPGNWQKERASTPLDAPGRPVLQMILSGSAEEAWAESAAGLTARDIAMNVSLPEVDGRILSRAVSFKAEAYWDEATECSIATYRARGDRISFVAELAANWAHLGRKSAADKRVALILANYPNKDGRLANGVGLDTPAATINVLNALDDAGFAVQNVPQDSAALMRDILAGPTNWLTDRAVRQGGVQMSMADYQIAYGQLPFETRQKIEDRWGKPEQDPFFTPGEVDCGHFALSVLQYGNVVVGLQPARGYNIDPQDTYHAPDLVPPHNYLAFYYWLRHQFRADAMVHMGKHGNMEWLPGKAVALSDECFPEIVFGPMPHLYPFIVNDPGEGTQAKRRAQAVIIDHLTPPLARAETYGALRDLEGLVDEYYEAAGVDPRRIEYLRKEIFALMAATQLDSDAGIESDDDADSRLQKLDAYLCELKEAQIRDGLHVFGTSPEGNLERDLIIALTRVPRADGKGANASLIRALAEDFGFEFDPLDCDMAAVWDGEKPEALARLSGDIWRSQGDTVERLELMAQAILDGDLAPGVASAAVLQEIDNRVRPMIRRCGEKEMAGLLSGLEGRFVAPGPSGAPSRGRLDVLPTGRNFFSVDSRSIPTRAAWELGWKSASLMIERYLQDNGDWPRTMALTAWGTANMRTGGDDIAQALALMGVKPVWDDASRRVTGFEVMPLSVLGRPRVDVTLRISGFFRDAFPAQVDLVASAARKIMELDEPKSENPAAACYRSEVDEKGVAATFRVFGSKPGAYGAGLQAMIDERLWSDKGDLAEAYLTWGSYAYGSGSEGEPARAALETRLSQTEAVVQNQDNREHDLLDSDDYYQFEGGLAASVETLKGDAPVIYHNDHSRPERPVIRTLDEEISRVVRSRVVNPKWIDGVKRHGYKGAFEIAATVDYLFAFSATTGAVKQHHFDLVYQAYLEDDDTREFIAQNNPSALAEIADRLSEAIERKMWQPRLNSVTNLLQELRSQHD